MLLIDYRSAFNNVIPSNLLIKLAELGITTPICNWLLDFETDTSQHVWLDHRSFSTITVNTGVPQGCVLSPFFYSLFTHDCRPEHGPNVIIKVADDTTMIGLNKDSNELAYREEVDLLAAWSEDNNLTLNTSKTKELIVDFRKNAVTHPPTHINGVTSFKLQWIHISQDLPRTGDVKSSSFERTTSIESICKKVLFKRFIQKNHSVPGGSPDCVVNAL